MLYYICIYVSTHKVMYNFEYLHVNVINPYYVYRILKWRVV